MVGAAAAVGLLLALGWSGGASEASGPESLTLPETVDGLRTQQVVLEELDHWDPLRGQINIETAERLSEARGGAAATAQGYVDDDFEMQVILHAVADVSPGLWTQKDSEAIAEFTRLATPQMWVERDGDVECLVAPLTPIIASEDDEDMDIETFVSECQLVDEGVTLHLTGAAGLDVARAADILNDAAANLERG